MGQGRCCRGRPDRHAAELRFEPDEAGECCRDAQRAAAIGTSAKGVIPAATEAAAPALDPPGVFARSQGCRVMPVRGESPTGLAPNSLVVVLPMMIAPAARSRSTEGASAAAMLSAMAREPDA